MAPKRIAIIGGGISGLATAYYLQKNNPKFKIRIFEASSRVGGILETIHNEQALMECGPDAFISEKPWALELCRELGLEDQIVSTRTEFRRSFVLCHGKLKPIPVGFYLTAPKTVNAWVNLPGMSWIGKLRMLFDLFLPAEKSKQDESVANFVCRRFGREALEKLAQPMIAGIYASRPEDLSLLATFPKFREMEERHGSIIRALQFTDALGGGRSSSMETASGPRYSLFLSLRNGMEALIEKLAESLKDQIQLSSPVKQIEKGEKHWKVQTDFGAYEADVVCLAVSSREAARLLAVQCPMLAKKMGEIRFEPIATINFLFDQKAIDHALDGFGFVVPNSEKRSLIGCSFSHRKFEGRAGSEQVLLRAFAGGAYGHSVFSKTDEAMIQRVLQDLQEILGISAPPRKAFLRRYPQGMPQYKVGHLEYVHDIFEAARHEGGLFLTGNSYYGIGIPDCIHDAKKTAEKILEQGTKNKEQG